jgi:hypothetical protein
MKKEKYGERERERESERVRGLLTRIIHSNLW